MTKVPSPNKMRPSMPLWVKSASAFEIIEVTLPFEKSNFPPLDMLQEIRELFCLFHSS